MTPRNVYIQSCKIFWFKIKIIRKKKKKKNDGKEK